MNPHSTRPLGRISALHINDSYGVYAKVPIGADELVFVMEGEPTSTPSRISVQIDMDAHIDLDALQEPAEVSEGYFWQFLNHSCEPSVYLRKRHVYALRPLQPGDEITFDYNTTELDMASPFSCTCGSKHCLGLIRGFAHLSPAQQQRLEPHLGQHLSAWVQAQQAAV